MGEFAIGQGVARFEDPRLIRGGGRYTDDVKLPGMAHGVMLRSPHAHARIKSIDTKAAKAAPGVLCVLTAADVKAAGLGELPVPAGLKRRDGSPQYVPRYPILAEEFVRWVGDGVAFVVAETLAQAQDAAELIAVDYEELPAVTSTEQAPQPGAPRVWADCADNICFVALIGDKAATDAAFARADRVVKHKFVINRVTAVTMEPRGAVGDYNAADGRYTIYTAMQRPQPGRAEFAKIMKVPESKLRIITGDTGGSFGMKSPIFNESPLVLLAAKLTGRPVKWISTRTEAFLSDAQGRDNVTEAELALDKDGVFLGMRVKTIAAIGAYLQHSMPAFALNAGTLAGVYRTPAMHVDITGVFTHTNPVRPYRGNGRPEAAFVIERMVDIAADELGIDPAELRRRNTIPPAAMPFKTGLTFTYDCGEFEKNMDLALALADAKGFKARKAQSHKEGKLRGFGLSNTIERAAPASTEGAEIRFARSGTATLFSGANNQGQGHETILKQLVCDRLGLDPAEVQYVQGDTDQAVLQRRHRQFAFGDHGKLRLSHGGREDRRQGARHRRASAESGRERFAIRRRGVFDVQDQPHADDQGDCRRLVRPGQSADRHGARLDRHRDLFRAARQLSERLPRLRSRDRTRHRQGRDRALFGGRRRRHRAQPAAAARADPWRHRARRRASADGGHPFRRRRADGHRLVHGLRHAARARFLRYAC